VSAHQRALEILTAWQPPTEEQAALRQEYLAHLETFDDGLLKLCFPAHLTAGVLVTSLDRDRVLLNLHGKAQRWFAFGGHIETDDHDLVASAWREGTEESGIADLVVEPMPVHLSKHVVDFCDPLGPVTHLDVRFVARVDPSISFATSEESVRLAWFDVDDLPTDEPDMVELIQLATAPR
jgi:8-oxo-dGTP pyrophosphatase MutT (NUDIX family)